MQFIDNLYHNIISIYSIIEMQHVSISLITKKLYYNVRYRLWHESVTKGFFYHIGINYIINCSINLIIIISCLKSRMPKL